MTTATAHGCMRLQTLFLYLDALPKRLLVRIWDIFLFERSWKIFFRVSLVRVRARVRARARPARGSRATLTVRP